MKSHCVRNVGLRTIFPTKVNTQDTTGISYVNFPLSVNLGHFADKKE